MNVAANGKQVVLVTWQNILIYDYNGHLMQSIPMSKLITNAGLNPSPVVHRPTSGPHLRGPRPTPRGTCQNATHFPFERVVDTFTWDGATGIGTYNAKPRRANSQNRRRLDAA